MTDPVASFRSRTLDVAIAFVIAVGAALLYSRTLHDRVHEGDGAMLGLWTGAPERAYLQYHNTLYLPFARFIDAVLPRGWVAASDDPLATGKSIAVVAAALGLAATWGCCRRLGSSRWPSLAGTLLLALAPAFWFFATAIEVHALHFGVVAIGALVTLLAPWHRPVWASAIAGAMLVPPYLSHQSAPVLLPGWLLLVQCARRRRCTPFGVAALAAIGAVLAGALLFGHMLVQYRRGLGFGLDPAGVASTVADWRRGFSWDLLWTEILAAQFLLVPLAVTAAVSARVDCVLRACAAALVVPLAGCILWWGIPERGGYVLGPSFILAVLASAWWSKVPRAIAGVTMACCLVGQAIGGWQYQSSFEAAGFQLSARRELVRQHLGAKGILVSANCNAPDISLWLPTVQEVNLAPTTMHEASVDMWLSSVQGVLRAFADNGRFALERSYVRCRELPQSLFDRMEKLESWIRTEFQVTEFDDGSWPIWMIEKR